MSRFANKGGGKEGEESKKSAKAKSIASASASVSAARGAKRNLDFNSVDRRRSPRKRAAITTLYTPSKRKHATPKKEGRFDVK